MKNGGQVGSRGYIFQAIIALIVCLGRDDWDAIKNEPNTEEDKVDIMLYRKDGSILSAIQVKSSINEFERADVKRWLESLKRDAGKNETVCLCLVGDGFAPSCKSYIEENSKEIKTVPFTNLQHESTIQVSSSSIFRISFTTVSLPTSPVSFSMSGMGVRHCGTKGSLDIIPVNAETICSASSSPLGMAL